MNNGRSSGYVGIMVRQTQGAVPFADRAYFRRITVAGSRIGVSAYVFSPDWIDWHRRTVRAYVYDPARHVWERRTLPLPSLVYDRAFFRTRDQLVRHRSQLARLLASPRIKLLGLGLPGKLDVHRMLARDPGIARRLPYTEPYAGPESLRRWLGERGEAVLKPQGGMHGKGVFHVRRMNRNGQEIYAAVGRSGDNRPVRLAFRSERDALRWVDRTLVAGRPFLLQQYLRLRTEDGAPFDIRALVQKDGRGRWSFTGAAARVGPPGGLTSNLHGGGEPTDAKPLLVREYGEEEAARMMQTIRDTALEAASVLESGHGPLLELGIDLGVDRLGNVWVLEVNSKPGRASFTRLHDKQARIGAVTRPIRYARYVMDRQLGGQIHEFDVKQNPLHPQNR